MQSKFVSSDTCAIMQLKISIFFFFFCAKFCLKIYILFLFFCGTTNTYCSPFKRAHICWLVLEYLSVCTVIVSVFVDRYYQFFEPKIHCNIWFGIIDFSMAKVIMVFVAAKIDIAKKIFSGLKGHLEKIIWPYFTWKNHTINFILVHDVAEMPKRPTKLPIEHILILCTL